MCHESKFDKKIPMGSVPNCRKEIANTYPMRWSKCKLKPPKNMSNCQKDAKLSKRCQIVKQLDYGGGSQKIDIMRFRY